MVSAIAPIPTSIQAIRLADLRQSVAKTVKTVLESALMEKLKLTLKTFREDRPRRSGYYSRVVDTQYGRIDELQVPKLRARNRERD
jgi:transposase-like protein